jgi:flagellar hook-basal body complex protein FliE
MPIDPSFAVTGVGGDEFTIAPVEPTQPTTETGSGFGDLLGKSLQGLADSQTEAANAAQALATGQASDPTAVVMAVERAQLAMQLASQIRTKAVEAAQDIFHTQV